MNNIKLEMLANRIEKTAILFELYKGLKEFFEKNPQDVVNISFSANRNSPKETRYITFKSSTDEGQSVVFSNVFHFLHKCVSLFDPIKSPFGLFSQSIANKPQEVNLTFNKDNFCFIFDYADSFDGKKEWLELLSADYIIVNHNRWVSIPKWFLTKNLIIFGKKLNPVILTLKTHMITRCF